ncbi:MAG: hypothetical protein JO242_16505 [Streptosporangiaceae bacterium]|nr:hypothetical protein [Streptosporangiaceae bacterium]
MLATALVAYSPRVQGKNMVFLALAVVLAVGLITGTRYLTSAKTAKMELTGGAEYRKLAEEYRRLSDMAITTQEHTDLKLGDVNVQLEYLRSQVESLQKILKEVE